MADGPTPRSMDHVLFVVCYSEFAMRSKLFTLVTRTIRKDIKHPVAGALMLSSLTHTVNFE